MSSALPAVVSTKGSFLYDERGRDHLDASSGVLNVNLGHGHPRVHHRRGQPERTVVLSEQPSHHGMTVGALALTGQPPKPDTAFGALIANGCVGGPR
ncbi:hypothetical protein ACFVT2_19120 [Streptomyces sp. NPDC058000]|uniref:hypothetical protein n=1 Tax=Streptomyces sp. NPDC058000 TaxID=3346299 RepID=UPI0036E3350D